MANKDRRQVGVLGEKLAGVYLLKHGFEILASNWRHRHWEIDIIAAREDVLHIIEVKTRTSTRFGYPEESITAEKMQFLRNATAVYLELHPQWKKVCFDVLALLLDGDHVQNIMFNEDVYF